MRFSGFGLGAAALAAALIVAASAPSSAAPGAPLSLLKSAAAEQSMVEKTHGWHRSCRKGWSDVHRHIRGVGRVTCTSRRCWTNSYGLRRCTWR
ncbi:MAG: hypothetical protein ABL907_21905 [Hyphomicrobium sp.]